MTTSQAETAAGAHYRVVGQRGLAALLANEWLAALLIFAVTRVVVLVGAHAGASSLVPTPTAYNKGWVAEAALMWDAAWYANISQHGYQYDPAATGGTSIAFAPLYPFLTWALSGLLKLISLGWDWGNAQYGATIAAGLLISNLSFFAALALLIKLLRPRLGAYGAALVALGMAALPLSFFFSAMYTEGLFLLLAVAALLAAHSDLRWKWLCAGLLGMLAALDRLTGVILVVALVVDYLAQRGWSLRRVRLDVLWLALVPLGLGIYLAFLWWRFGTPMVLYDTQVKGWNHGASLFVSTYWDSLAELWRSVTKQVPAGAQDPVLYYGQGSRLWKVLDLGMPVLLLAGGWLGRKKLLAAEWAWLLLGIVYPLSSNITFSLARYTLPLWPGLIWLGALPRRIASWVIVPLVVLSLALLAWCSSIYASARWIG